jgi:hypothetical protein
LRNPATNLTYAVRYLAGAFSARRRQSRSRGFLYARGYYYDAKSRGQTVQALALPAAQSFALLPAVTAATIPAAGKRAVAFAAPIPDPKRDREP